MVEGPFINFTCTKVYDILLWNTREITSILILTITENEYEIIRAILEIILGEREEYL